MNASSRCKNKNEATVSVNSKATAPNPGRLWPALIVLGGSCGLAGGSVSALELGNIAVRSTLGEPLRASIAYALGPNESIGDHCIYLEPGRATSGLPTVNRADISVADGAIRVTGRKAVQEPLLALQLTVDCPNTAHLSREYSVFVSPVSLAALPAADEPAATAASKATPSTALSPAKHAAKRHSNASAAIARRGPIASADPYRVRPGETLSGIALRIAGRSVSIWQAADALFAANPDAFIRNDQNLLKAGALLVIPDSVRAATDESAVSRSPAVPNVPGSDSRQTIQAVSNEEPAPVSGTLAAGSESATEFPVERSTARPVNVDQRPNEEISSSSGEPPAALPSKPETVVRHAVENAPAYGSSWAPWLAGSGIALILGVLLFGRKFKSRLDSGTAWLAGEPAPQRRKSDGAKRDESAVSTEVDFRFDDPTPGAQAIPLDGDLDAGTGFHDGGEIDVAEDFGFSASGEFQLGLDMDFSSDAVVLDEQDTGEDTDINPSISDPGETTVEHAMPPAGRSEEDEVSMIADTTRDRQAIEVDTPAAEPPMDDTFALSSPLDYEILERDYEDELTATQALNAELAAAARQLVNKMKAGEDDSSGAATIEFAAIGLEPTTEMPQAAGDAIAAGETALVAADSMDAEQSATDDSGVNEELTTEMPAAENDATAEMDLESRASNNRKKKAS